MEVLTIIKLAAHCVLLKGIVSGRIYTPYRILD